MYNILFFIWFVLRTGGGGRTEKVHSTFPGRCIFITVKTTKNNKRCVHVTKRYKRVMYTVYVLYINAYTV